MIDCDCQRARHNGRGVSAPRDPRCQKTASHQQSDMSVTAILDVENVGTVHRSYSSEQLPRGARLSDVVCDALTLPVRVVDSQISDSQELLLSLIHI